MDFGMKLQDLRKAKGLSQEALAEKLNVSRQAVSKWESGVGYPEMDKLILLSDLFGVTIDYLIKDQNETLIQNEQESKYFMSHEKLQEYMQFKKGFGFKIASSVSGIIIGVILTIIAEGTTYETIAIFGFLLIVALAVFCMIVAGISCERYNTLEKQNINMSFQDLQNLQNEYSQFKMKFGISIAFGVFLIIISTAAIILLQDMNLDEKFCAAQLMFCVACAVFIFIYQGIKEDMYRFLIENKQFIKEKHKEEHSLYSFTMPLAAMIFVFLGLTKGWWHPGWIIFPVTAILTSGIESIRNKE
ncbi:MAG: helix-turn-helix domain-containing protein [Longibaculum sp.]